MPRLSRSPILSGSALLLVLLGVLRLAALVGSDPMTAYANQYDMARTSACLGLWPDRHNPSPMAADIRAPYPKYRYGLAKTDVCLPSSEVALVWVALQLDRAMEWLHGRAGRDFDLRQLVWIKSLLLIVIAFYSQWVLRRWPEWQLASSAVFALLLCDPFNTLFIGTLYTEFTAIVGAWTAILGMVLLDLRVRRDERIGLMAPAMLMGVGLGVLGTSRVQHLLHPFWLTVVLLLAWVRPGLPSRPPVRRAMRVCMATALAASLLGLFFQSWNQTEHAGIADANRVNSLFASILPASQTPEDLLGRAGLPPHCVVLNHVSWYRNRGHVFREACPELDDYSRTGVALALMREPATLARLINQSLIQSSGWRLGYLGEVAGSDNLRAPFVSLADWISTKGLWFQFLLWAIPLLQSLRRSTRVIRGTGRTEDRVATTLSGWVVLTWAAAILGDGFSELTRHLHLAQNALLALWMIEIGAGLRSAWRLSLRSGSGGIAVRWSALSLLAVALPVAGLVTRVPSTMGILTEPPDLLRASEPMSLQGMVFPATHVRGLRLRAEVAGTSVFRKLDREALEVPARFLFPALVSEGVFHTKAEWDLGQGRVSRIALEVDEGQGFWREIDSIVLLQKER